MLSERDIERITSRIAREYAPLVVGLFGSYAIGTPREDSDLDIFVIMQSAHPPPGGARAVRRMLFGVLHPLDIHVFTPEEFEEEAYETLSFAWVIARQARVYHAAEEAKRLVPSLFERRKV